MNSQLLNAVQDIQMQAQTSLPVIPNNGNPNGANNMPAVEVTQPQPQSQPTMHYPWAQPSPAMTNVRQLLSSYAQPPVQAQPAQVVQQPTAGTMNTPLPPVIPTRSSF